jgi:4-amino-4-deoxy-L-arabinose transferase-like glycosyltransferase
MRRASVAVFLLALAWSVVLAVEIEQPGYTDAFYYFNAAQRLVDGQGLTDPYLWVYINSPDHLPGPSHTYWMPLASLLAATGMFLGGSSFIAAQVPFLFCFSGLVLVAFRLGGRWGKKPRHAWTAALLVMFSGFFVPFWTTTDTFALFGFLGALALVAAGRGREEWDWRWVALSGAAAGLAHLARADGVLLLLVLVFVIGWSRTRVARQHNIKPVLILIGTAAYLVVMCPWFVRNLHEIGTPLPAGGSDTIWLRGYDEIVNYPPGASLSAFWDWGLANIIQSRFEASLNNLATFMQAGVIYALALHLAMTLVFAFPGYRGGLFHSSSALLPFWAGAATVGLEASVSWAAKRRHWPPQQAQTVFGGAAILLAIMLSVGVFSARVGSWNDNGEFFREIASDLPSDAVVMVNDPAGLYFHTGLSGVVIPNAAPDVIPEISEKYGVTHLILDINRTEPFTKVFLGEESPPFLRLMKVYGADTANRSDDRKLYEIVLPGADQ